MRPQCPVAKDRLIGVADIDGARYIELGDLTAAVPRWPGMAIMRMAVRRQIRNRQFVPTKVARKWAAELDKEQSRILLAVLDWADQVPLNSEVNPRVHVPTR